jgi:hypothetical protein
MTLVLLAALAGIALGARLGVLVLLPATLVVLAIGMHAGVVVATGASVSLQLGYFAGSCIKHFGRPRRLSREEEWS